MLLQAYISQLKLEGFALMADMVYVTQVWQNLQDLHYFVEFELLNFIFFKMKKVLYLNKKLNSQERNSPARV